MSANRHAIRSQSQRRQRQLVERRRRRIAYRLRDRMWPEQARPMMTSSNIHCAQERGGRHGDPVRDLVSIGAYRVMAALAWSLKAWFALMLPETGRWREKHRQEKMSILRMEFKKFVNAFVRAPAQVVRSGRRIVPRLLSWNPWQAVFPRGVEAWRQPLRC